MAIPNFFALKNFLPGPDVRPFVGPPAHFLPQGVSKLPPKEKAQRLEFWGSAMLLETVAVCVIGTLAMHLKGCGRRGPYNRVAPQEGGGDYVAGGEGDEEVTPEGGYQERDIRFECDTRNFVDIKEYDIAQNGSSVQYLLWRLRSKKEKPTMKTYERDRCELLARRAGREHHLLWRLKNQPLFRLQMTTGTIFLLHFALSTSLVLWCSCAGLLSVKTGLPWEGYFAMLSLGNLWCLLQALCLEPAKFAPSAFALAMVAAVVPFFSDAIDTFKDIQFAGLCLQAEHGLVRLMGVVSLAYVPLLHFRILQNRVGAAELAETYLSVLFASAEREAELTSGTSSSFPEFPSKVWQLLYKQTTKEKQYSLLYEGLLQGGAAVVFLILEGGSPVVFASAVLMPLLQLTFAYRQHDPLSKKVLPWIVEELAFAARTGNVSKMQLFLKPLMDSSAGLLAFALEDVRLGAPTRQRIEANKESLPLLHAAMKLLASGDAELDLSNICGERPIEDHGFSNFVEVLRDHAGHLQSLKLEENFLDDEQAKALMEACDVSVCQLWQ